MTFFIFVHFKLTRHKDVGSAYIFFLNLLFCFPLCVHVLSLARYPRVLLSPELLN